MGPKGRRFKEPPIKSILGGNKVNRGESLKGRWGEGETRNRYVKVNKYDISVNSVKREGMTLWGNILGGTECKEIVHSIYI